LDERVRFATFVVFVKARGWCRDSVPREKVRGAPRIFSGDERHFTKHAQRPGRNVFEVADWRGNHEQSAGHKRARLLYCREALWPFPNRCRISSTICSATCTRHIRRTRRSTACTCTTT